MDAREIIQFIADAKKVTPVKIFLKEREEIDFSG
ncbi:MAG: 2,3,4,5-tetrahydropyridine-2,6-dicarboxylate N-acetyltransferase, partial [Synergistaceae bacterium]|nr:2,3,4,5-tetrahydropyridine-2,6-dicarboxylate N-acetyltransferase [Synergistaceae bacterium]